MRNLEMSKGMFYTACLAGAGVMADLLLSAGLFCLPGDAAPRWCIWPYPSSLDSCCKAVPHEHALFESL